MQEMSRHHRKMKCHGGKTSRRNVIKIKDNLHRAWHVLFGNMLPADIARLITTIYLDPDYEFICVKRRR